MTSFALNNFVLRQTRFSPFSWYAGDDDCLLDMIAENFADAEPGYRDGVCLVPVPSVGFFSGVVKLKEGMELTGSFKARREGEEPRKEVLAVAEKLPAKFTEIVLYRKDVLAEGGDNTTEADWEVVSINCNPEDGPMPIAPMTLLHNHFGASGGTETHMSDSELVAQLRESYEFWKDKSMCAGISNLECK